MNLDVSPGSVADLGDDGVMVSKTAATAHGWKVGDPVTGGVRRDRQAPACTWSASTTARAGSATTTSSASPRRTPSQARSWCRPASSPLDNGRRHGRRCRSAITTALADHPDAKVLDQKGFEKEASGFIDQLLTFVTVMLLLAVVIALLGIVNTLALSVFERTRELGLLRAVGMTRGQVRAMVRWESVVISLIGAADRCRPRDRHRAGAVAGAEGRGHQVRSRSRSLQIAHVRRAGRGGRCGRRRRPGPLGGQGRRAQGGGHRLTVRRATARPVSM